jgi:glycosyltransferase involved in cell wall biosynthesis
MKEVLITNAAVSYDVIGGASKAIDDIADQLTKEFDKINIFVPNRSGIDKPSREDISPKITIFRYKYSHKLRVLNPIFAFIAYFKFFKFKKFELIWGNSPEPWLYIPKNSKKKIYTVHGPWKTESNLDKSNTNRLRERLIDFAYSFILKTNTLFHFQSDYVFNSCLQENSRFKNIKKIIIPVLLNEQKLLSMHLDAQRDNSDQISILVARRLVNRTGVKEFINLTDGFGHMLKITIIGDGYQATEIQNMIIDRPDIRFLGKVEDSILYREIIKCDLVCMPSLDAEGFGASILQALFLLRPVLYTNIGGMKEFLNQNPDCFSFDPYNRADFKNLLQRISELKNSEKLNVNLSNINYSFSDNLNKVINA